MKTIAFALLVLSLAAPGCASRNHLTSGYGQSYHQALARQAANPEAGKDPVPSKGLDPQEASVISQGYRASLSPKGDASQSEPVLMVAPSAQRGSGRPGDYMPPASVPTER